MSAKMHWNWTVHLIKCRHGWVHWFWGKDYRYICLWGIIFQGPVVKKGMVRP